MINSNHLPHHRHTPLHQLLRTIKACDAHPIDIDSGLNGLAVAGVSPYKISINGIPGDTQHDLPDGQYTYTIIDINGCVFSGSFWIGPPMSTHTFYSNIKVFPSTTNNSFSISCQGKTLQYSVIDLIGNQLLQGMVRDLTNIDISQLQVGQYIVRLSSPEVNYSAQYKINKL